MLKTLRPSLLDICGFIFILCILLSGRSFSGDPGVGWHLKSGEIMSSSFKSGAAVFTDPFLYSSSEEAKSWINNQYLSDLIFFKAYTFGGFNLLESIVAAVTIISFITIPFILLKKLNFSPLIIFFSLLLTAFQASVQFPLRPVIFSFFFFSLVNLIIHLKLQNKIKCLPATISLGAIFAFWANLHPAFILGLILIFFAGVSETFESYLEKSKIIYKDILYWLGTLALCFFSTFLTPFGPLLWKNIGGLAGNKFFMNLNQEWLSPNFFHYHNAPYFLCLCLIVYFLFQKTKSKLSYFDYLSLAAFAFLSLEHIRNIGFFALVSVLPLAKLMQAPWSKWRQGGSQLQGTFHKIEMKQVLKTGLLYTHLMLLFYLIANSQKISTLSSLNPAFPKSSLEIISASSKNPKIFHSPNIGGYISWTSWPKIKPWIDDRNQLNGEAKYKDFLKVRGAKPGWKDYIEKENFDYLLIENQTTLNSLLKKHPNKDFQLQNEEKEYSLWKINS